jgi:hypothetical protein
VLASAAANTSLDDNVLPLARAGAAVRRSGRAPVAELTLNAAAGLVASPKTARVASLSSLVTPPAAAAAGAPVAAAASLEAAVVVPLAAVALGATCLQHCEAVQHKSGQCI